MRGQVRGGDPAPRHPMMLPSLTTTAPTGTSPRVCAACARLLRSSSAHHSRIVDAGAGRSNQGNARRHRAAAARRSHCALLPPCVGHRRCVLRTLRRQIDARERGERILPCVRCGARP
jgi:hypothetical protein